MAGSIYRCAHCQRLSLLCAAGKCSTLNRPFSSFCRRCRSELTESGGEKGGNDFASDHAWREAAEWGHNAIAWDQAGAAASPDDAVESGALLADLSELPGFRLPKAMVAMRFIDGLLAIHQAGAFVALVHPFHGQTAESGARKNPAVAWAEAERVSCPGKLRPFPPFKMPAGRHVIFSTPLAVHAMDVWSLKDWAYHDEPPRYWAVADCSAEQSATLAAPPVPLGDEELGLLLRADEGGYLWAALHLPGPEDDFSALPCELPIQGAPCRARLVARRTLAFATPRGHWVWDAEDARVGDLASLRRTWPPQNGTHDNAEDAETGHLTGHLAVDQEDENPGDFSWRRQFHYCQPLDEEEPGKFFTWYYQRVHDRRAVLESYKVYYDSLKSTDPQVVDDKLEAAPLGPHRGHRWEMLFTGEGKLLQESPGGFLTPLSNTTGPIDAAGELTGLIYRPPLVVGVGSHGRRVTIRPVDNPIDAKVVHLPPLYSDPLVWSHWLFTNEFEGEGRLVVRRRDLRE